MLQYRYIFIPRILQRKIKLTFPIIEANYLGHGLLSAQIILSLYVKEIGAFLCPK